MKNKVVLGAIVLLLCVATLGCNNSSNAMIKTNLSSQLDKTNNSIATVKSVSASDVELNNKAKITDERKSANFQNTLARAQNSLEAERYLKGEIQHKTAFIKKYLQKEDLKLKRTELNALKDLTATLSAYNDNVARSSNEFNSTYRNYNTMKKGAFKNIDRVNAKLNKIASNSNARCAYYINILSTLDEMEGILGIDEEYLSNLKENFELNSKQFETEEKSEEIKIENDENLNGNDKDKNNEIKNNEMEENENGLNSKIANDDRNEIKEIENNKDNKVENIENDRIENTNNDRIKSKGNDKNNNDKNSKLENDEKDSKILNGDKNNSKVGTDTNGKIIDTNLNNKKIKDTEIKEKNNIAENETASNNSETKSDKRSESEFNKIDKNKNVIEDSIGENKNNVIDKVSNRKEKKNFEKNKSAGKIDNDKGGKWKKNIDTYRPQEETTEEVVYETPYNTDTYAPLRKNIDTYRPYNNGAIAGRYGYYNRPYGYPPYNGNYAPYNGNYMPYNGNYMPYGAYNTPYGGYNSNNINRLTTPIYANTQNIEDENLGKNLENKAEETKSVMANLSSDDEDRVVKQNCSGIITF